MKTFIIGTTDKKLFITRVSNKGYSINTHDPKEWKTHAGVKKAYLKIAEISKASASALKVYEVVE